MEHHAWLDESVTLSRNKAKPGECVLSCWEAPSAADGLQASPEALSAPLLHTALPAQSMGTGWSSETDPAVWGWCAPCWAFLPWRQAKQRCRSRSVVEGRRGLEKGWFASCCFLMSKGKSTWFSTGSFDVITCLSAWHGLAQLQHEFHNSFAGFINPQLLECRDSVTPSWISNQSGDQLEAVGCLLPLGRQRLASQIPGAGVLSPFSCAA